MAYERYADTPLTNFPSKEDNWSRMSDLSVALLTVARQYSELYNNGNLDSANALLKKYPELKDALFTPERWNQIRDAVIALERFFLKDVDTMITEVAKNTIGINDNATGSNANTNTYSATKINEKINDLKNHFTQAQRVTIFLSGWSTTAPYTQTVTLSGVKETDTLDIDMYFDTTDTAANIKLMKKSYSCLDKVIPSNNTLKLYAYNKKPISDFTIKVKGASK